MSTLGFQLALLPAAEMPQKGSSIFYRGGRRIIGTLNRSRKCDDRCLTAKSDKCNCSCGGANHGARA
jgi:hypothetical protein